MAVPIERQIAILDKLSGDLKEDRYEFQNLETISSINGEIFRSLDKSELLRYAERKHSNSVDAIRVSNQVHGLISVLVHLQETLKSQFIEYKDQSSNRIATVSQNLHDLSRAFSDYGIELERRLETDPIQDKSFQTIFTLFQTHIYPRQRQGDYDVYQLENDFLEPLARILAGLRHDASARSMAEFVSESMRAIKGLRAERRYWHKHVESISSEYREQLKDIPKMVKATEGDAITMRGDAKTDSDHIQPNV